MNGKIIQPDEIWYWYLKNEEFKKSGLGMKEYCNAYGVNYKKFCNTRAHLVYTSICKPDLYSKDAILGRKYLESGSRLASKFSQDHNIPRKRLSAICTHLRWLDIIESRKKSKEEKPMQFIQVPTVQGAIPRPSIEPEHEIMEKQNDIEIIISKGVKVSISPNIDSIKIIKIIELLKDL